MNTWLKIRFCETMLNLTLWVGGRKRKMYRIPPLPEKGEGGERGGAKSGRTCELKRREAQTTWRTDSEKREREQQDMMTK